MQINLTPNLAEMEQHNKRQVYILTVLVTIGEASFYSQGWKRVESQNKMVPLGYLASTFLPFVVLLFAIILLSVGNILFIDQFG